MIGSAPTPYFTSSPFGMTNVDAFGGELHAAPAPMTTTALKTATLDAARRRRARMH